MCTLPQIKVGAMAKSNCTVSIFRKIKSTAFKWRTWLRQLSHNSMLPEAPQARWAIRRRPHSIELCFSDIY